LRWYSLRKISKENRENNNSRVIRIIEDITQVLNKCFILTFSFLESTFVALSISVISIVIIMEVLKELDIIKEEASYIILRVAMMECSIIISMLGVL
jgi:CPA2 family monovalent cation:H+ antiporter-2